MRSITNLFKQVLGEPYISVMSSSQFPKDIIKMLEKCGVQDKHSPVVLHNGDVWRYGDDKDLLEYFGNDSRTFYILTVGYENRKILDNVYELSWPAFYFTRPRDHDLEFNLADRTYGFSCLNNNAPFHRLVLGCALWKSNLLKDMIFTQNFLERPIGYYELLMKDIDGMDGYLSILPLSWDREIHRNFADDHTIKHPAYIDTYCNIATETEMQEFVFEGPTINLPTITEKSYKPFRSRQIPIWLAARGHCEYLKSLGFETMEDILPSGYDDFGLFDKVDAIVQTVAKGRLYAEEFYHAHLREIEHNYGLVQSTRVESVIIDNIKNFLAKQ